MINVQEIEKAVSDLPPNELSRFRKWFDKFDAAAWDKQFEKDARLGRLDEMADRARTDFKDGKFKEI